MPIAWCSHPVAHSGSTKIGCRPTHPKADRRIDAELAVFIKKSYGVSNEDDEYGQDIFFCRTCFERETLNFIASESHRANVKASSQRKMDIRNEKSERPSGIKTISKRLFDMNRLNNQGSESLRSQSSEGEGDDDDHMEYQYQRQESIKILNDVFEVLKIPRIVDT